MWSPDRSIASCGGLGVGGARLERSLGLAHSPSPIWREWTVSLRSAAAQARSSTDAPASPGLGSSRGARCLLVDTRRPSLSRIAGSSGVQPCASGSGAPCWLLPFSVRKSRRRSWSRVALRLFRDKRTGLPRPSWARPRRTSWSSYSESGTWFRKGSGSSSRLLAPPANAPMRQAEGLSPQQLRDRGLPSVRQ